MKANELRIGNYVETTDKRHNEKYIKVESILFETINVQFREYNLKHIQPIPLTEEWLIKFGFKNHGIINSYCFVDEKLRIDYLSNEYFPRHVEFVHELQNIYFALTGEDLF